MDTRDQTETSFLLRNIDRGAGKRQVKLSAAFWDEVEQLRSKRSGDKGVVIDEDDSDDSDFHADDGDQDEMGDSSEEGTGEEDAEEEEELENEGSNGPEESEGSVDLMAEAIKLKDRKTTSDRLICAVCLGDTDTDGDEIVECDGCGISVHEGCYGISDTSSIGSTSSSCSTEPWFCEACKAGNPKPTCQLCPNKGGVFKETDVGQWVHLTCALFIPGIAFGDPDGLSAVTLFEMSYSLWGARSCALCTEEYLARTGVCIGCDAALCKVYFHVTCALREGLLHYPHEEEQFSVEAMPGVTKQQQDLYYAHCLLHTDKRTRIQKKTNFLALQGQIRHRMEERMAAAQKSAELKELHEGEADDDEETGILPELDQDRIVRKLRIHRAKYNRERTNKPIPWVPTQKMPRLLSTSPTAVRRLLRKAELMGIHTPSLERTLKQQESLGDVHKKWHIPPAFTVEFIGYYFDRTNRMCEFKSNLASSLKRNAVLDKEEKEKRQKYEECTTELSMHKDRALKKRELVSNYAEFLSEVGAPFTLPPGLYSDEDEAEEEQPAKPTASAPKKASPKAPPKAMAAAKTRGAVRSGIQPSATQSSQRAEVATVRVKKEPSLPPQPARRGGRGGGRGAKFMYTGPPRASPGPSRGRGLFRRDEGPLRMLQCEGCKTKKDQHLLVTCDVCNKSYHLACVDPPLTRMPKKTKLYGWQCSECLPESTDEELEKVDTQAPRQLRQKISKPKKFLTEDDAVDEPVAGPSKVTVPRKHSTTPLAGRKRVGVASASPGGGDNATTPTKKRKEGAGKRQGSTSPDLTRRGPPVRVYRKQEHDRRVQCDACKGDGNNDTLVRCDECRRCYHFGCLDPPLTKSPKVRGYSWHCQDCDLPSSAEEGDEDAT